MEHYTVEDVHARYVAVRDHGKQHIASAAAAVLLEE